MFNIFRKIHKRVHRSNYIIALAFLVLAVTTTFLLLYPDVAFWKLNNEANNYVRNNNFEKAQALYTKAKNINKRLGYIAQNNLATYAYNTQAYGDAEKNFEQAMRSGCHLADTHSASSSTVSVTPEDVGGEHCGAIAYNLANTQYRVGEAVSASTTDVEQTVSTSTQVISSETQDLWLSAIGLYQLELSLHPEDSDAKENIDFILQKLNASSTKAQEQQKQSKDGTSKDENSSDTSSSKDTSENAEKSEQQNDTSSNTGQDARTKKDGNDPGNQSSSNAAQDGKRLSDQASQELDARMQKIEQQSRNLQKYFTQNPEAAPQTNDGNPFNDPFFQSFFGGTTGNNFNAQPHTSLDKDW